jgi:hypothetical protein
MRLGILAEMPIHGPIAFNGAEEHTWMWAVLDCEIRPEMGALDVLSLL